MYKLTSMLTAIKAPDAVAAQAAREHQACLTKPLGSLGRLELLSIQLAGICRNPRPQLRHKAILVMAADHGVAANGVSAYPQAVTRQMVLNFLDGGAAVNVLARQANARLIVVDMGMCTPLPRHPQLLNRRMGPGTADMTRGPAMSRQQAMQSLEAGIEVMTDAIAQGLDLLATGEMGIGNSTAAAAIATVLTGEAAMDLVGRGTGVDDPGLARKIAAVEQALAANQPDPDDAVDVLAKVGGFEIGGLVGAMLAAAGHGRPILVDGYITTAAAMLAVRLAPQIHPYLIAAHRSQERGHDRMLAWLDLDPLLDLELRLGEGTGAALAIPLIEGACRLLNEMATFESAGISEQAL